MTLRLAGLFVFLCAPAWSYGQPAPSPPKPSPKLGRWIDLQNATLNVRYRVADNSAGTITTNQVQHRESLRARLKFDRAARYTLNVGAFSGSRFTSGWNNSGIGRGDWQDPLSIRLLYAAAQPVRGVEAQYGSLVIIKGQTTELTSYDEDGYLIGQRLSLRRPQELFFDEISATIGYLSASNDEIGVSRRVKYLDDAPNYRQFLVGKRIGKRAGASVDVTSAAGARTWRAGGQISTPELGFADEVTFENYRRTNATPEYGFALSLDKQISPQVALTFGAADIDPFHGGLNSDRFNIGRRVFFMTTWALSPRFSASWFVTTGVGRNAALPQRSLSILVFTYNALPDLRGTGLF